MALKGALTLSFAVRGWVVLALFGHVCLSLTGLSAVPLAVALATGDHGYAWRLAVVTALLAGVGLALRRLGTPSKIQRNEALVTVALTFLAAGLLMSWPFAAAGIAYVDALFESVSGVTTTGLSTLSTVEGRSPTFLFTRSWLQWYGGLVIVVLAVAIVMEPGAATKRLAASQDDSADLIGSTRARARRIFVIYAGITAAGFLLVWLAGAKPFSALVHVLSAISTGGFSSYDDSLAGVSTRWAQVTITLLSVAGAVSFSLYERVRYSGWRALAKNDELQTLLLACLLTSLVLMASLAVVGGRPLSEVARDGPLLALSAQTTTGFATLSVPDLDPVSKLALILSMVVGGEMGSTAGGIKIVRVLLVLRLLQLMVLRTTLVQHAVVEPTRGGKRIGAAELQTTLAIVLLFLGAIALAWFPFLALGLDPLNSLFDIVSAFCTVGLSAGVAGADLASPLKLVLCLAMIMGRLEILAILVLLYPRTWLGRRLEVT